MDGDFSITTRVNRVENVNQWTKVGIMIQGNWPITFTDLWGGVTVGTGGAGVGLGGTGISQLDIGGGLIIAF